MALATGCSGAEPEKAAVKAEDGGARLVLEWPHAPDYAVTRNGSYVFVRFSRPFTGPIDAARDTLGRHLADLRLAGGGRVLVMRFAGEPRFAHWRSGNAIVLTWTGAGPAVQAIAQSPGESGPARRWPKPKIAAQPAPARPTAPPESPGQPALRPAVAPPAPEAAAPRAEGSNPPPGIARAPEPEPPKPRVRPAPEGPIEPREAPRVEGSKPPPSIAEAPDPEPPKPSLRPAPEGPIEPREAPRAEGSKPPPSIAEAPDPEPPKPRVRPAPEGPIEPREAPRAEGSKPPPSIAKAPDPEPPKPTLRPPPEARPAPGAPIEPPAIPTPGPSLTVSSDGAETRVVLAWPEPVAAAAFRYGDHVWVVFARREAFDVEPFQRRLGPGVERLVRLEHAQATILAARVGADVAARVSHERNAWTVILKRGNGVLPMPDAKLAIARGSAERVTVPLAGAEAPIRVVAPELGSALHVIPSRARAAVGAERAFVTFRLVPAVQGGVVEALADGLIVEAEDGAIVIRRSGGLFISNGGSPGSGPDGQ